MGKVNPYRLDTSKLDAALAAIRDSSFKQPVATPLGKPANRSGESTTDTDPSIFSRVLDVLSRPLYTVQNVIKDAIDPDPLTDNPFESAWAGFSGIDKTMGHDVIEKFAEQGDTEVPDWVKG